MSDVAQTTSPGARLRTLLRRPFFGGRRRPWLIGGGAVVVVVVLVVGGWQLLRLLGLLKGGTDQQAYHVVQRGALSVTLKEDGELKPVKSVDIKCEVPGGNATIQWVIEESTRVKAGDLLVKLASAEFRDRVRAAEIEFGATQAAAAEAEQALAITKSEDASRLDKASIDLAVAELELERYMKGDYERSLKQARINIQQSEMDVNSKRDEYEKSAVLLDKKFISQSKYDELRDALKKAELTREMSWLELEILENYEQPKNKMQKEAAVAQTRDELEREKQRGESREKQAQAKVENQRDTLALREVTLNTLKEQLAKCEIRAPADGMVQYAGGDWRWGNERVAQGQKVFEGQTLITLPDTSQMKVTTRVHEADRHKIREGLTAQVRVPAVPERTFTGRISKIAQFADSERSWWNPELKEHAAEIVLENTDAPLSPGDTAHVEIFIEDVPDVLSVPVQCVFARGDKRYVFVQRSVSAGPAEIKLGRSSSTMVEVTDGLSAGDKVVMAPDERLLALLPGSRTEEGGSKGSPRATSQPTSRAASQPASAPSSQSAEATTAPASQAAETTTAPATGPASQSATQPTSQPATQPAAAGSSE